MADAAMTSPAGFLTASEAASNDATPRPMPRTVALFLSCAADLAMPAAATAAREVLEALGVRVVVPPAQTCCGQVALNSGHREPAISLARRWVEVFAPYDAIVSPSGSCVATVHHAMQRIAEEPWAAEARAVAARTQEFTQFVAEHGAALRLSLQATVAWHDSCHMLRGLGERHSAREVLRRVNGLTLHDVPDAETCCGFGGTFATKFPEVSCEMADRKLRSAAEAQVTRLVSADPGCLLHLGGRAAKTGVGVRTMHVAELLRDAMVGSTPERQLS
jgi:L-lactate dehydrogenase complex protein LldE